MAYLRKALLGFVAVIAIVWLALRMIISSTVVSSKTFDLLNDSLKSVGAEIKSEHTRTFLWGMGIADSQLAIRPLPFPFVISKVNFTTDSPIAILGGTIRGVLEAALYDGTLNATAFYNLHEKKSQGELHLKEVNISKYPLLGSFGVTSAVIFGDLTDIKLDDRGLVHTTFKVSVERLEKPNETQVPGIPIPIPPLTAGKIDLTGQLMPSVFEIKAFSFKSSIGDISGQGIYKIGDKTVTASLKVSLSDDGIQRLGPLLPFIPPNTLTSTERHFLLTIHGAANHPFFDTKPIGQ